MKGSDGSVHAQKGEVRQGVGTDQFRIKLAAVIEGHRIADGAFYDVMVGEDVADSVDDDAGAALGLGIRCGTPLEPPPRPPPRPRRL